MRMHVALPFYLPANRGAMLESFTDFICVSLDDGVTQEDV